MEAVILGKVWCSFGCSVTGANHTENNKPNQDAFLCQNIAAGIPQGIMAVSDGHGGDKYVRSDKGSRFAVKEICETVLNNNQISIQKNRSLTDKILSHITANFYQNWTRCVDNHLDENPLTESELSPLKESDRNILQKDGRIAYACTISMAATYDDMVLIMQHGDGDILFLYEDGTVTSMTAAYPGIVGDETPSLGDFHNRDTQYRVFNGDEMPVMITLFSDGVKKSFDDKDDFMKIPCILRDLLINKGMEETEIALEKFLSTVTNKGSGDDVTLTVLYRSDKICGNADKG